MTTKNIGVHLHDDDHKNQRTALRYVLLYVRSWPLLFSSLCTFPFFFGAGRASQTEYKVPKFVTNRVHNQA